MKKMATGLAAAALATTGLTAATTTSAAAEPYSGNVTTSCNAKQATPRHAQAGHAYGSLVVDVPGNGKPVGQVTFTFKRNGSVIKTVKRGYEGGREVFDLGTLAGGTYNVVAYFNSKAGSVYKDCTDRYVHDQG